MAAVVAVAVAVVVVVVVSYVFVDYSNIFVFVNYFDFPFVISSFDNHQQIVYVIPVIQH